MVWVPGTGSSFVRPIKLVDRPDGRRHDGSGERGHTGVHEGDTLDEGTVLVTGENAGKAASATTNPFAPAADLRPQQPKKPDQ